MFNPCEKKCTLFHCKCSSILLNYTFFPQKSVNKIDFHFLLYNINYTLNVVRKKVLNSASIILNINKVKLLMGNHNRIFFFHSNIFKIQRNEIYILQETYHPLAGQGRHEHDVNQRNKQEDAKMRDDQHNNTWGSQLQEVLI